MIYNALSNLTGRTITDPKEVILQGFAGSLSSSTTGMLIKVDNVYSISEGTVMDIGKDENNLYVVTIMYQPSRLFRYCCLKSVSVSVGEYLIPTTLVGVSNKSQIRFEYCTLETSPYPVRFLQDTYYKQDPSIYLMGIMQLYMSVNAGIALADKQATSSVSTKQNNPILTDILTGMR